LNYIAVDDILDNTGHLDYVLDEMLNNYEKKLKLYLAFGGLFITFIVGIPAWIVLFIRIGG
jgi:hypothetical protein